MRIAFQGELGSNGHELCKDAFPGAEPLPCATFATAFAAVRAGECDLGLIAMENSAAGRVGDVHALLPEAGLRIVGERFKRIRLFLMANPGVDLADVRTVRSHVMAIAQCRRAITDLGLVPEVALDTAGAARELAERPDPQGSAIAPRLAAELHGLTILREAEDDPLNTTRFIVVSADAQAAGPPPGARCITSLFFKTRDVPAALYKAIGSFATNGVNLLKLESYMEGRGHFRAARFYAEIAGRPTDRPVALALDELAFFTNEYALAGVYEADPSREFGETSAAPAPTPAPVRPAPPDLEAPPSQSLGQLRHTIDNIDAAVVHLLAERFKTTRQVGLLKAEQGLPASDPDREREQLVRLRRLAQAADLDPIFAEKFLAFVIAEVVGHHDRLRTAKDGGAPL